MERPPGVPKITTGGWGRFPWRVIWRELRPAAQHPDPTRDSEIAYCESIAAAHLVCDANPPIWDTP